MAMPSKVLVPRPTSSRMTRLRVGRVVEDVGDLAHLDHEGGLAAGEVVLGADAREDAVDDADAGRGRGHEGAHLGHEHEQRGLADVGALAGHVRAGDERDPALAVEHGVVRDEALAASRACLDHGMARVAQLERPVLEDLGPHVVAAGGDLGEGGEHVELGEHGGGGLQGRDAARHLVAQRLEESAARARVRARRRAATFSSYSFSSGVT